MFKATLRNAVYACIVFAGCNGGQTVRPTAIESGPMNGFATQTEVGLWLRLSEPGTVRIRYWSDDQPSVVESIEVDSKGRDGRTVTIVLENLKPGSSYRYGVQTKQGARWVEAALPKDARFRTQVNWHRRSEPPNFKTAFGSCAYINDPPLDSLETDPYGGGFEIFNAIGKQGPDLMLWLGDAVYLRAADWGSPEGIYRRYKHARAFQGLRPLLAATQNYAIWDDHDFGPNDSDRSYVHKGAALDIFKEFWMNPSYGLPEVPGVFGQFSWSDVDFFLLDNRYHRDPSRAPDSETKSQLGSLQYQWLIDALTSSSATFKVVVGGGQFLSPFDFYESFSQYRFERDRLIADLSSRRIEGVLFLSGDRHHGELVKIQPDGMYPLYDFTSSPLTSRGAGADRELNSPVRVDGTLIRNTRNFGLLSFSGPPQDRRVLLEAFDQNAKRLWHHEIKAKSLKFNQ